MPPREDDIFVELEQDPLFKTLDEGTVRVLAANAHQASILRGQVIYDTGDLCNGFFVILSGKVVLEKDIDTEGEIVGVFNAGDHFGVENLSETSRKRLCRATATEDATLLKFNRKELRELTGDFPDFRRACDLEHRSFTTAMRKSLPWRNEQENIVYISRKHIYYLIRSLILPILTGVLLLIPLGMIYFLLLPGSIVMPIIMIAELMVSFFWSLWKGWDWTNDYYVITNQRVLNLEKVVLFYESRQETPLEAVLSVETDTSFSGRWLGFGTIRARTFTGAMEFRYVESPDWVVRLLQEYWSRVKTSQVNINQAEVEADIRSRINGERPAHSALPVNPVSSDIESSPLVNSLADLFKLKEIQGDSVIYRTHWWILVRRLFLPIVFLILWALTLAAAATGFLGGVEITTFFSLILLGGLVLWIWFLYRIVDWRNDYYMITSDQIFDVHRRPLGSEEKRSAPLKNIQTIEYNRLGMLGVLLNFGTVFIRIGDTQFTFDYVSDPSSVQKELFQRFMDLTRRQKKLDAEAERERIADYIDTYHRMTGETGTAGLESQKWADSE